MEVPNDGILKNDSFRVGEPCPLGQTTTQGAAVAAPASQQDADGPVARVIEQAPTHAIVEIVCTCGKAIQMRCDYDQ